MMSPIVNVSVGIFLFFEVGATYTVVVTCSTSLTRRIFSSCLARAMLGVIVPCSIFWRRDGLMLSFLAKSSWVSCCCSREA